MSVSVDSIKLAPSVVPTTEQSSIVGEWINKQEKYQMAECSNCKKVTMHEMKCDICKEELDGEYLEFHCADGTSLNVCFDCMACYPNKVNDKLDYINKHLKA